VDEFQGSVSGWGNIIYINIKNMNYKYKKYKYKNMKYKYTYKKYKIPPNCCICLPCAQTGVRSGVVIQKDWIQVPAWPDPSISLFLLL
jgi:hypothetical protein